MQEETLKELIERSAGGDHGSFRVLAERLEDRLFGYIHARVQSRDDALDTLQDVLVDIWQALPRFTYRSDAEFYGFLYTIAKRRVFSVWGRRAIAPLPEEVVDSTTENQEDAFAIDHALDALDEVSREIILLKHWSRYTFAEIGAMLSIEEGTVRVRHHRALKALHDSLTAYAS
jgi:RNA polymerase sigma-70 factor (ECF subfamily)